MKTLLKNLWSVSLAAAFVLIILWIPSPRGQGAEEMFLRKLLVIVFLIGISLLHSAGVAIKEYDLAPLVYTVGAGTILIWYYIKYPGFQWFVGDYYGQRLMAR